MEQESFYYQERDITLKQSVKIRAIRGFKKTVNGKD